MQNVTFVFPSKVFNLLFLPFVSIYFCDIKQISWL